MQSIYHFTVYQRGVKESIAKIDQPAPDLKTAKDLANKEVQQQYGSDYYVQYGAKK